MMNGMVDVVPEPGFLSRSLGVAALVLMLSGLTTTGVQAQSACSSDNQPRPTALLERFINADCVSCWSDPAAPVVAKGQVALDWVVPGSKGEDAPLAAVARSDSLVRWQAGLPKPTAKQAAQPAGPERTAQRILAARADSAAAFALRIAHGGLQVDYIGASIGLKPLPRTAATASALKPWTASLALVESLPIGTEGSPVARNLVRNLLQAPWFLHRQLSKKEQALALEGWLETRSMNIPPGAKPERLRVIGWLEDSQGRLLAAAESRCVPNQ